MKSLLTLCLAAAACAVFAFPAKQARVDIYIINKAKAPALKVVDQGGAFTAIPGWMKQKDRSGANAIFNFKGTDWQTFKVTFEAVGDGRAEFRLMGPDVRDAGKKKNLPANVDVQKFTVNGKVQYDGKDKFMTVWHNTYKGNTFSLPVRNGEKIVIELVCRPSAQ